jgi:tRNA threonylcarbamoyladenosine dehydratase
MRTDDYEARFSGIGRLFGIKALDKIKNAKILVIGIGGVGSWVAESLARTGIGHLTLVDLDDVCVTNINRQVHATSSSVGQFKVEVMKNRVLEINPFCEVDLKQCYFSPKNLETIFDKKYDFVIDACDDFTNKCHLIQHCKTLNFPLITIGAAGGKTDPLQIRVTDLSFTSNDKFLARLRKKLRQDFSFPNDQEFGIWCVWSHERSVYPTADGCTTYKPPGFAKHMDCSEGFGSASFLTGAFAFAASSFVIREMTKGV